MRICANKINWRNVGFSTQTLWWSVGLYSWSLDKYYKQSCGGVRYKLPVENFANFSSIGNGQAFIFKKHVSFRLSTVGDWVVKVAFITQLHRYFRILFPSPDHILLASNQHRGGHMNQSTTSLHQSLSAVRRYVKHSNGLLQFIYLFLNSDFFREHNVC